MIAEGLREKARGLAQDFTDDYYHYRIGLSTEEFAKFATRAMTLALEEAERAVREKRAEATKWQLCAFADGYLGALESTETLLASLRSELGSGPEGEER